MDIEKLEDLAEIAREMAALMDESDSANGKLIRFLGAEHVPGTANEFWPRKHELECEFDGCLSKLGMASDKLRAWVHENPNEAAK